MKRLHALVALTILAALGASMAKARKTPTQKPQIPATTSPKKLSPEQTASLRALHEADLGIESSEARLKIYGNAEPKQWILTPKSGFTASEFQAEVASLEALGLVKAKQSLFSKSERLWLGSLSQSSSQVQESLIAEIPHPQKLSKLLKSVAIENASTIVNLEADAEVEKAFSLPSFKNPASLQWGMSNDGSGVRIELDGYRSAQVDGKTGEDSGALRTKIPESKAKAPIIVAVLDTGIDWTHPALAGKIQETPSECQALQKLLDCQKAPGADAAKCQTQFGNVDTDQNGYPLDCRGFNITAGLNRTFGVWGNYDTRDDLGHGTHVAGVVTSATNQLGFRGVIENAKILPVRVISRAPNAPQRPQSTGTPTGAAPTPPSPQEKTLKIGSAFTEQIGRGMLYAIRNGAKVINLSMAWPKSADSPFMRQMTELAQAMGVHIVASAGNDSTDARVMPCQYDGVICVASHGPDGRLSHFSNHGAFADLAAPGTAILSTWPLSIRSKKFVAVPGYEYKNGTSMAAPFVAGAVARLLNEGTPDHEVRARLMLGSRPLAAPEPATSAERKQIRFGSLDLDQALAVAAQPWLELAKKNSISISWDRRTGASAFSFELINRWDSATEVQIQARLESADVPGKAIRGVTLTQDTWTETAWAQDETRKLTSALDVLDTEIDGRAILRLTITPTPGKPHTVFIPMDWSLEIRPSLAGKLATVSPGIVSKPILYSDDPAYGQVALPPGATLRSIQTLDLPAGSAAQGTWLVNEGGIAQDLGLLQERADRIDWTIWNHHFPQGAEVLQFLELDATGDGVREFAFLLKIPPATANDITRIAFEFVSPQGDLIATLPVSELGVVLDPKYVWVPIPPSLKDPKSPLTIAPLWIFDGALPELNQKLSIPSSTPPEADPWGDAWDSETAPQAPLLIDRRVYLAGSAGILALPTADLGIPVEVMERARITDPARVLFAIGDVASLSYRHATVQNPLAGFSPPTDLTLSYYRTLLGVPDQSSVMPLDLSQPDYGKIFSTPAPNGGARITQILGSQGNLDSLFPAPYLLSLIKKVVSVFQGGSRSYAFAHTDHDLVFRNLSTGESSITSLDRFSFMPQLAAMRLLTPILIQQTPAIYIPSSVATSDTSEVVLPVFTGGQTLTRPARLRFKAASGCEPIGNPIPGSTTSRTRITFVCEDQIVFSEL